LLQNLKTMKAIIGLLLIFFLIIGTCLAQPAFPSVSSVYTYLKTNKNVYSKLKDDYKIPNPEASTWEQTYIIGGGDVVPSEFRTFKSQEWRDMVDDYLPDDRAYVVFTLTTPKSTEGVIYKLPVIVEYSRIKEYVIQDSWEFLWWYIDEAYEMSGGNDDQVFFDLFMQDLKSIEPNINPHKSVTTLPDYAHDFISIQSIEKDSKPAVRDYSSGNVDLINVYYKVTGTTITYDDFDQTAPLSIHPNSVAILCASYSRDKANGQTGAWSLTGYFGGFGGIDITETQETKTLYATLLNKGFDAIYKKEAQTKEVPYYTDRYEEEFEQNCSAAIIEYAKTGNSEALMKFINPTQPEILNDFKSYFDELKQKCVILNPEAGNQAIRISLSGNDEPEEAKVNFAIDCERPAYGTDKALKTQYKNAGISKEVMLNNQAQFYASENIELTVKLINNQYKLTSGPKRLLEIPF